MKRQFTAASDDKRCKADITVGKIAKEGARCMKAAKVGDYCCQHAEPTKYRVLGSGVSIDGWFKVSLLNLKTNETVTVSRGRVAELRRENRIED